MTIKKEKSSLTKIYGISVLTINLQFILFNSSCDIATKTTDAAVTINEERRKLVSKFGETREYLSSV